MRRRFWRVVPLLLALVLVTAATACSKNTAQRWSKSTGSTYRIHVAIPETNPLFSGGDNQEAWFVAAVQSAVSHANSHPDLQVNWSAVSGPPGTICDDNFNNFKPNCVEAWLVPNSAIAPFAGQAIRFANPTHYFNGNPDNTPADPARLMVANDWTGQPAGARENAVCHELFHLFGLDHADMVDTNGDGTPDYQPEGPCVNAVPDKDPDAPYDQAGYDWQNLDIKYDTCVNDTFNAPGGGPIDPENDDLSSGGYDSCGGAAASAQSFSSSESPSREVESDSFAAFD